MKFPDLVHAVKPAAAHAMPQAASAHDTFGLRVVERKHAHVDVGDVRPRDPRQLSHQQGFGVNCIVRQRQGRVGVHQVPLEPVAGTHSWSGTKRQDLGADPDFTAETVGVDRIRRVPEYELGVQIITEEQAEQFSFDVSMPPDRSGRNSSGRPRRLVLNRKLTTFRRDRTSRVLHGDIVPGVDFSNDPLLAGRIHSYVDTQLSRWAVRTFTRSRSTPDRQVHNKQPRRVPPAHHSSRRVAYEPNHSPVAVRSRPGRWASRRSRNRWCATITKAR